MRQYQVLGLPRAEEAGSRKKKNKNSGEWQKSMFV
jgi:hypothetical protein